METSLIVHSLAETNDLAKVISKHLFEGFILGLTGDLGAGKTTFTKYLAKHMGINETLNSPTFTILKIYDNQPDLYHMDVYRLEDAEYDYELDDYIYGPGVSVIEWYQFIESMLPDEFLKINIRVIDDTSREIHVSGEGRYEDVVKAIDHRYSN